jgi:hypothetical protein
MDQATPDAQVPATPNAQEPVVSAAMDEVAPAAEVPAAMVAMEEEEQYATTAKGPTAPSVQDVLAPAGEGLDDGHDDLAAVAQSLGAQGAADADALLSNAFTLARSLLPTAPPPVAHNIPVVDVQR